LLCVVTAFKHLNINYWHITPLSFKNESIWKQCSAMFS
jgi:hypothetical protein